MRVEEAGFVARRAGQPDARLLSLARDTLRADAAAARVLDALLETWARKIELRPVFAAFWEDLSDVFGATPGEDPPGWADELRDRLGLAHHDPAARAGRIDVLIFRYRVDAVPGPKSNHAQRLLVPPTVLDGRFSPAFCPAPTGGLTGHTLDLGGGSRLCREVLHPTLPFRAVHLFRVGAIERPVSPGLLREARGLHLAAVRAASAREDYALGTDGDLQ